MSKNPVPIGFTQVKENRSKYRCPKINLVDGQLRRCVKTFRRDSINLNHVCRFTRPPEEDQGNIDNNTYLANTINDVNQEYKRKLARLTGSVNMSIRIATEKTLHSFVVHVGNMFLELQRRFPHYQLNANDLISRPNHTDLSQTMITESLEIFEGDIINLRE